MKYQEDEIKHQDECDERWISRSTNYGWDECEPAYCDEFVYNPHLDQRQRDAATS
jgi:hypothetical protein